MILKWGRDYGRVKKKTRVKNSSSSFLFSHLGRGGEPSLTGIEKGFSKEKDGIRRKGSKGSVKEFP